MRMEISTFKSKLGKRIFLLFISCALVPIVTLALISFYRVSEQLRAVARSQLSLTGKSYAMQILYRLEILNSELQLLVPAIDQQADSPRMAQMRAHWAGISSIRNGTAAPVLGDAVQPVSLTAEQSRFLLEGGTVLSSPGSSKIVLLRYRDVQHPEQGLWAGTVARDYLFGTDYLPANLITGVADASARLLFCSESSSSCIPSGKPHSSSGWVESTISGNEYESAYQQLFLRAQFRSEPWTIVLSQNATDALAPMRNFRNTFPYVVLLSLWAVILLSSVQIRRTLVPLERLRLAAKKIQNQQFETRVEVSSADEFGELANTFNAMAMHLGDQFKALENLSWGTLKALARAIDAKSAWTAGHSERVTQLALRLGREMGLSAAELTVLERGGLLHDIGKIGTPPDILDKPARLTPGELKIMRDHVVTGVSILEPIPDFRSSLPIVGQHHERFDGTGYPHGLAGEQIDFLARILSVADFYDALVSDRPYRKGLSPEIVIQMVIERAGTSFDPKVVPAFAKLMGGEPHEYKPISHALAAPCEPIERAAIV